MTVAATSAQFKENAHEALHDARLQRALPLDGISRENNPCAGLSMAGR